MQNNIKEIAVTRNIYELSEKIAELVVAAKRTYPENRCKIIIKKYTNSLWLVSFIIN